jgi:multidrug resistance efflux pump
MIKALRKRTRPDNLVNQVRAGGKNTARRVYLGTVTAAAIFLVLQLVGPFIFLDADGLVTKDRMTIAPDFNARILKVHVRPGDLVRTGDPLVTLSSSETLDRIAELTSKLGAIASRETQLAGRLKQASTLLPVAEDRKRRAQANYRALQDLARRQLTVPARVLDATRELFESEREEAQLRGEGGTVEQELSVTSSTRSDLARAIEDLRKSYNNGVIVAATGGQVGPKVVNPGTILKLGESALDIYSGESYVVAYLPTNRLYSVEGGDSVIITDGTSRARGRILRIEAMADALPPEFQNVFSSRERQQVARVELESGSEKLSVTSKVKVIGPISPTNILSMFKSAVSYATATVYRIAGLEPEFGAVDNTAVGSVGLQRPNHSAFELPPDIGPQDWRALTDRTEVKHWKTRD